MLQTSEVQDVDGQTLIRHVETSNDCIEIVYLDKDRNHLIHRSGGPAFIRYQKTKLSVWHKESEIWYNSGVPGRKDGPTSIIYSNDSNPSVELWSEEGFTTKQTRYYNKTSIKKADIFHSKDGSEKTVLYDMNGNITAEYNMFFKCANNDCISNNDSSKHCSTFVNMQHLNCSGIY